jgi:hypothetical protein
LREEIKEIIKYRIEQAEDALKDAVLLFDSGGEEIGTGKKNSPQNPAVGVTVHPIFIQTGRQ